MSNDQLSALKEQLASLTPDEKLELAKFLTKQAKTDLSHDTSKIEASDRNAITIKRSQHPAWLKEYREQYAGQYVVLDGDGLVGCGSTIREAHEQARQQGIEELFLVHVSSVEAPFGDW